MPKVVQIAISPTDEMFVVTDCGHVLFEFSDGWKLLPEPDWEALGLAGDPEPAQPAPPESPWVKVGDRLPDESNSNECGDVFVCWANGQIGTVPVWTVNGYVRDGLITHWMEIPEVPCDK